MIEGVDVSRHQKPSDCDWNVAAAHGLKWASYKLSEGRMDSSPYIDPAALEHRAAILDAGLVAQPYHFARLDNRFAEGLTGEQAGAAEAEWAAVAVRRHKCIDGHRVLANDVERYRRRDAQGNLVPGSEPPPEWCDAFCLTFVDAYAQMTGQVPDGYMGPRLIKQFHTPDFGQRMAEAGSLLWMARPDGEDAVDPSSTVPGWPWAVWQYTHTGSFPGLPTPIDRNRYRGSAAEFAGLVM